MGFDKRYEGIDEYAVQIIKYKARQLVGRVGFTEIGSASCRERV